MSQRQQQHTEQPASYTGPDGKLRPALFDEEAQAEAQLWVKSGIKTAQVRRFYGAVIADRRRFESRPEMNNPPDDSEAQVAMAMLKASTAYAAAREDSRKPLAKFAEHHARLVKNLADFNHFTRHFEAVVAWHCVFEKENKQKQKGHRS